MELQGGFLIRALKILILVILNVPFCDYVIFGYPVCNCIKDICLCQLFMTQYQTFLFFFLDTKLGC